MRVRWGGPPTRRVQCAAAAAAAAGGAQVEQIYRRRSAQRPHRCDSVRWLATRIRCVVAVIRGARE